MSIAHFKNRFALHPTIGQVVNVTNESSDIIEHEAETTLKAFVAGDRFTVDRKFKSPINVRPATKIMVATNDLPRFIDKTQGIWRRILLIPFDEQFTGTKCEPYLADKLKKELPGILNWALAGLKKLTNANGFTIPKSHAQHLEDYRRASDPARAFLYEYVKPDPDASIRYQVVYSKYRSYCRRNGFHAVSQTTFGKILRRIYPEVKREQRGSRTGRHWYYTGLAPNWKCGTRYIKSLPEIE